MPAQRPNRKHPACVCENLEGRTLLSVDVDDMEIVITGTATDDVIRISLDSTDSNTIIIDDNGVRSSYQIKGLSFTLRAIRIQADAGNDAIFFDESNGKITLGAFVFGGDGDDTIITGSGNDFINGEAGNDSITGGGGGDRIYGDAGDDTLIGGGGNDHIFGGAGADIIAGQGGNDYLDGGADDDGIGGGIGNDEIHGGDGNDSLWGEDGNDTLFGELGDDQLVGGRNSDVIYGDEGDDYIVGNSGNDTLFGGRGNDEMYGGTGNDLFECGAGKDSMWGSSGQDIFVLNVGDVRSEIKDLTDEDYYGSVNYLKANAPYEVLKAMENAGIIPAGTAQKALKRTRR